jgi:hypothetical protein
MSRTADLKAMVRDIEVAISETDKVRHHGGHRHGLVNNLARAGWNGDYWVAYAKIKNRWRVVGKAQTYQHAIRTARSKALKHG